MNLTNLSLSLAIAALLPFASPAAPVPVGHARLKVIGYVMDGPTLPPISAGTWIRATATEWPLCGCAAASLRRT